MIKRFTITAILATALISSPAFADQEASNTPYISAGKYSGCYAKSLPKHIYDPDDSRQEGETKVYFVDDPDDRLALTFNWFSNQVFVQCYHDKGDASGVAIVRLGPWQRGHEPNHDHLAIAFYFDGQLSKSYSSLDIAGEEKSEPPSFSIYKNVSVSVSHYTVFEDIQGLVWGKNGWEFRATTVDGRILTFDLGTGEILNTVMPD